MRYNSLLYFCLIFFLGAVISGCTTYTWPDGSRETVIGVPVEDENARYEDTQDGTVRYRIPGEVPDTENTGR